MKPAVLTKLLFLTAALAISSMGCAHTQQPERKVYVIFNDIHRARFRGASSTSGTGGAGAEAYCNKIEQQTFAECFENKPEWPSIKYQSENHYKHCITKSREAFVNCVKELEQQEKEEEAWRREMDPSNFSNIDSAIAWFRRHAPGEPPLGTIITVGGVEFTLAELAGALVLAP